MMHPGAMSAVVEVMREMWGLLNEEQKKEVMKMRMDILTQWMEAEIANEERMIGVKKNAVASIKKVNEMMK
jgi:hypothetical protein